MPWPAVSRSSYRRATASPATAPNPSAAVRGFFFSSSRRHTRYWRDWSSDVCSSDLEAIRLKEKGAATEVVVVSVGPAKAQETLRTALAMGSDRAILVQTDDEVEPLAVAKIDRKSVV